MAAKNKFLNAMKMPSIDDMFSSEADRQRESGDLVTEVPLSELHPFVGHPFEVRDDEDMQKLVDSIRENGVLTNLTVRRRAEGGYEIISGHRRFHAAQRAGLDRVKVQVWDIDDDQAIISMVDSNIQREHISPMEKARAYRMKYDALKRQGCRTDLTSPQVAAKLRTDDRVAADAGVSGDTVRRFIRLNNLVPDLQKKVDDGSLKFNPAVELSYLSPTEQNDFLDYIESQSCSPSLSQAQKGRTESQAISDIIDYVANPQKTDNGKLITGYGCDSRTADAEFLLAKRQYISATGRVRGVDDVIAYHVRQSFKPGEITPEEANRLGVEFAKRFTKGNHAFVVCTHIDKSHIHNHIIWSAVNADCDRKFRNFWGSTRAVRRLSDTICIENGLSIVENPKPHGKSYNKWLGDQAKPSHREQLRVMIDRALEQKPTDFDALLKLLTEMGCEVSRRGKAIRLKAPGWKNVARMDDKLGAGYSEAEIRAVLAGEKQHTPRKNSAVQPEPPKVNLLVDIQAKLQAGKGAGYVRWAKVFNLKQMAQTVNFLTEHQLLDYGELAEKAAAATAHHNELSAQIKAAEKRMAEIAVLRTHIINYAKTRETYVAYRKAGYSRKFREEHEQEILLHQAAKNAFDEMGVKKLPKVKDLQAEYAKLLEEKKKTYAEYRHSREEMRELLTAKANVDRVLKMEDRKSTRLNSSHEIPSRMPSSA